MSSTLLNENELEVTVVVRRTSGATSTLVGVGLPIDLELWLNEVARAVGNS